MIRKRKMLKSNNMKIIRGINILVLMMICFNGIAQTTTEDKVNFSAKYFAFNDVYQKKYSVDVSDVSELSNAYRDFERNTSVKHLRSKGFHEFKDSIYFVSVFFNQYNELNTSLDTLKAKTNMYFNSCQYIIACVIRKGQMSFYKLKGFELNQYSSFIIDHFKYHFLNINDLKDTEWFIHKYNIEDLDLMCLHKNFINGSSKKFSDCCVSCSNRDKAGIKIYLIDDKSKVYNNSNEQLKKWEGVWIKESFEKR